MHHPLSGGHDDAAIVVTVITGAAVCPECISMKGGIRLARVESILASIAATIAIAVDTRPCDACREPKRTYRLDAPASRAGLAPPSAPSWRATACSAGMASARRAADCDWSRAHPR